MKPTKGLQTTFRSALLIVAHGSRKASSNEEVMALKNQIAVAPGNLYDVTECAFLELTHPRMENTIDTLIEQDCTSITIVPYFLAAGRHVAEDLPRILAAKQMQYPDADIRITEHLGCSPEMADLILKLT